MYDGIVDLLHHTDMYISPIQAWIKEACRSTSLFEKQSGEVLHACDFQSNTPILNFHAGLHVWIIMLLLWLVTKDKGKKTLNLIKCLDGCIGFIISPNILIESCLE